MAILLSLAMTAAFVAWLVAVVSAVRAYRAARRDGQPGAGRAIYSWMTFARDATGDAAVEVGRTHRAMLAFFGALVLAAVLSVAIALTAPTGIGAVGG